MFASASSTWSLPREKVLTRDEVNKVLALAQDRDARDYVFFAISANTGLRLSEVIHIRQCDIQDGRLRITRRKKKKLTPQVIDVPPALWELMAEWGQMFEGMEFIFPGKAASCVIKHRRGAPETVCEGGHVSRRNVQRRWRLTLQEAGLVMAGRGIHTLRHYAVTEFYAATRDLRAAQMYAGHSSSSITERYAHVLEMREKVHAMKPSL